MLPYQRLVVAILTILSSLHPARAQNDERPPDTMEARVLACAPCHGARGQGTGSEYFPRLAGKPAGYLHNQLIAFRDGRRRYPPMNYLLAFLPDAYLGAMADHFAAQDAPLPPPGISAASREVLAQGQALAMHGNPARGIPACMGCHGTSFTGMEPAIPGLLGLRPGYISAQIGAWRYGTRTAPAPDCMQFVAARLTETDVTAVSAWLSMLPAPANPAPAPQGSIPMLLPCGSQPN